MRLATATLLGVGVVLSSASNASLVTFEAASSTAGPQPDALSYRTVVDAALAVPGARSRTLSLFNHASNQSVFSGSPTDIAFRFTIQFEVTSASAGNWGIRAGVDFGRGGAVFLDGAALAFNSNDMWWAGSYTDSTQSFQFDSLPLTAGMHILQIYGLEDCCDGGQQALFSIGGAPYVTFGAADGLLPAPVPEPENYALMLTGLGVLICLAARRSLSESGELAREGHDDP